MVSLGLVVCQGNHYIYVDSVVAQMAFLLVM
jgi:hypothetical protein